MLEHGTGAINVDGCRVGFTSDADERESKDKNRHADFGSGARENAVYGVDNRARGEHGNYDAAGRWPANVVLDPEAAAMLDEQTGDRPGSHAQRHDTKSATSVGGGLGCVLGDEAGYGDSGGASRFFYVAKASRAERNAGLEGFESKMLRWSSGDESPGTFQSEGTDKSARNHHPTVKPIALMRWLVRLVTPPGGTVLDPFTGSGTTGCAAALEGFDFTGIEREAEYAAIAEARIAWWAAHPEGQEIVAALEAEAVRQKVADTGQLGLLDSEAAA